jgi:hypothetical protein
VEDPPRPGRRHAGLIVSPFGDLSEAAALVLTLRQGAGGAWLKTLRSAVPVTPATGMTTPSVALAFTWTGLAGMGLGDDALRSFSLEFREGMHQADRSRRLGDTETDAAIPGGPLWSGNNIDPLASPGKASPPTSLTAHAVLLLYAGSGADLDEVCATAQAALAAAGVTIARPIRLQMRPLGGQTPREHFGFADGISQLVPYGEAIVGGTQPDRWHGVPAGEIIFGQPNAHAERAPGPLIADDGSDPLLQRLPTVDAPPGYRNLGRNGSYLVIRELRQDVAAFWNSLDEQAAAQGDPAVTAEWLAERVVDRQQDGTPPAAQGGVAGQPASRMHIQRFRLLRQRRVRPCLPVRRACPTGQSARRPRPRRR